MLLSPTVPLFSSPHRPIVVCLATVVLRAVFHLVCFQYRWKMKKERPMDITLDNQTQVDSKPASPPEHASLNQCQLKSDNRPKLMLWAPPAGGGDKVSL